MGGEQKEDAEDDLAAHAAHVEPRQRRTNRSLILIKMVKAVIVLVGIVAVRIVMGCMVPPEQQARARSRRSRAAWIVAEWSAFWSETTNDGLEIQKAAAIVRGARAEVDAQKNVSPGPTTSSREASERPCPHQRLRHEELQPWARTFGNARGERHGLSARSTAIVDRNDRAD